MGATRRETQQRDLQSDVTEAEADEGREEGRKGVMEWREGTVFGDEDSGGLRPSGSGSCLLFLDRDSGSRGPPSSTNRFDREKYGFRRARLRQYTGD
ncbi:hypothetical protein NL676_016925 [Syzygium grande]|nr:hypothetical protein NL676_016925 [Syzygium grande]